MNQTKGIWQTLNQILLSAAIVLCGSTIAAEANTASAKEKKKNSRIEVTETAKEGKILLAFRVSADSGMQLTLEAPWKLNIEQAEGLDFEKTSYVKADLDQKLPGFVIQGTQKGTTTGGQIRYKLTAFLCTDDKTRCFFEVHNGVHDWKQQEAS